MLNQTDIDNNPPAVVRYLSTEPPPEQHVVFSILHAYVFSKSRRGNLPSETLSKLLSVQRKLLIQRGSKPFPQESPVARAFEAMRIQMLIVNKKWLVEGVSAFGPLGAIGSTGGSPIAIEAWRKATDNKIKSFPTTSSTAPTAAFAAVELDAGRVIGPGYTDSADPRTSRQFDDDGDDPNDPAAAHHRSELVELPPSYDGPPPAADNDTNENEDRDGPPRQRRPEQDAELVEAMRDRFEGRTERPASLTTAGEGGREGGLSPSPPSEVRGSVVEGDEQDGLPPRGGGGGGRNSIEAGVSELARLRALKEERERLEEESNRRLTSA
ncbi:hypothetical protein JCM3766R1_003935 [Sporobolomyces carnicolor]